MDTTTTAAGSNHGFGAQYDDAIQGAHKTLQELTALQGDMLDRGAPGDPTRDELDDLEARVEMVSDMIDRLQEVCDFAWEALDT
jgi:hypothetical protein